MPLSGDHADHPMIHYIDSLALQPSCFRTAARELIGDCSALQGRNQLRHDERKTAYALQLVLCELQLADLPPPAPCAGAGAGARRTECLQALQQRPQWWTSFHGYLQHAEELCSRATVDIERDDLVQLHRNLTLVQEKILARWTRAEALLSRNSDALCESLSHSQSELSRLSHHLHSHAELMGRGAEAQESLLAATSTALTLVQSVREALEQAHGSSARAAGAAHSLAQLQVDMGAMVSETLQHVSQLESMLGALTSSTRPFIADQQAASASLVRTASALAAVLEQLQLLPRQWDVRLSHALEKMLETSQQAHQALGASQHAELIDLLDLLRQTGLAGARQLLDALFSAARAYASLLNLVLTTALALLPRRVVRLLLLCVLACAGVGAMLYSSPWHTLLGVLSAVAMVAALAVMAALILRGMIMRRRRHARAQPLLAFGIGVEKPRSLMAKA